MAKTAKELRDERINTALLTKTGALRANTDEVMKFIMDADATVHPCRWEHGGRHTRLVDYSFRLEEALKALGISYKVGNDAPRGGQNGKYYQLTPVGKREARKVAAQLKERGII